MVDLKLQGDVKTGVEKDANACCLIRHVTLERRTVRKGIYYYNHYYGISVSAVDFESNFQKKGKPQVSSACILQHFSLKHRLQSQGPSLNTVPDAKH
jgi:hypothetical protein